MLLESCADMVLHCSDGRVIPCVRFKCEPSCEVIRHVLEDVVLEKDSAGRAIVPFPNVSSADLAKAMDVIHKVRPIASLAVEEPPMALRGMRALGHQKLIPKVLHQLWTLVACGTCPDILPYVNELLHTPAVRADVLRKLVLLCPTWPEFSSRVLGTVRMDVALATWMLRCLGEFFPAGPTFVRVLDMLPLRLLDASSALGLFTRPNNAASYHPQEALDVLVALATKFDEAGWDAGVLELMRALTVATQAYDVAPLVANNLHGTIILLETEAHKTPLASVLVVVNDRRGAVSRKLAPWLWLHADWETGVVNPRIALGKLDGTVTPRQCHVRLTAYARTGDCAELWYVVGHAHPLLPFNLVDSGRYAAGDVGAFRGVASGDGLTRLRIDLFYGTKNPLETPLF